MIYVKNNNTFGPYMDGREYSEGHVFFVSEIEEAYRFVPVCERPAAKAGLQPGGRFVEHEEGQHTVLDLRLNFNKPHKAAHCLNGNVRW